MPITGRTPEKCFNRFRDHLSALVAATLTAIHQLRFDPRESRWILCFREQRGPITIPLRTRFGILHFYCGQLLETVKEGKEYRLQTQQYWYRLQEKPGFNEKAVLRWEYDKALSADEKNHCRNHLQIATAFLIASDELNLDKVHLPTGWVTLEEVIRFLIVELDVEPPCGREAWPAKLAESERAFFEEFTSKRYRKK